VPPPRRVDLVDDRLGFRLAAGLLAAASVVLAWSRRRCAAFAALILTAGAIAGASGVAIALFWRWTCTRRARQTSRSPTRSRFRS